MGIRFVIGRAGVGKTRYVYDAIVGELRERPVGSAIYLVVPKQSTFMAERWFACASGLGGYCRLRVVSFEGLVDEIVRECGGGAIPEVNGFGRQMILGHLLRKHEKELRFFAKVARQAGLPAKLEATLGEFELAGKGPEDLDALMASVGAGGDVDGEADPFSAKLHDLCLIYRSYCAFLGQERIDPRRRMERVLGCIPQAKGLHGAMVFVDGFLEFSEFERRLIARLGGVCRRVEVALLMDASSRVVAGMDVLPGEFELFHRTERAYVRLRKVMRDEGVGVLPPVLLKKVWRFEGEGVRGIERGLFGSTAGRAADGGGVTFVEAPDRRREAERAAAQVGEWVAGGLRLRDIVVLVRDLEKYHDLLAATFREAGIKFFADRRRQMAHHPLLHLVRASLAIAGAEWPHEPVMTLLKSGLTGLTSGEADRLENYVLEHRLRGRVWCDERPWRWKRRRDEATGEVDLAEVDQLRRRISGPLAKYLSACGGQDVPKPLRGRVVDLVELFRAFRVGETLSQWVDAARGREQHEQSEEHEQVWSELMELLDQMVELMGDEAVDVPHFREIVEAGLETFDLAITPPTVDEVLVGQVDRTRTVEAKGVLVLGLNEGVFPRVGREASILSNDEREELERRQFEVSPGTERKLLDEDLYAYIALTRAREFVYVSRATADEKGRTLGPSAYWVRLREMFGDVPVQRVARGHQDDPALVSTPRQLLTGLMRWARGLTPAEHGGTWAALYQWVATNPGADEGVAALRGRAWGALGYDNVASLPKGVAQALFQSPLKADARQIEAFATCPFQHFLAYGLGLREREESDEAEINLDHALHHTLEQLVQEMLRNREEWASLSPGQARDLVERYARMLAEDLRGEFMLSSARNRYLLSHVERQLEQIIAHARAAAGYGGFGTAHGRVEFGKEDESALPALVLKTPGGRELHLAGRIDRVDVLKDQAACVAIDYRLSPQALSLGRLHHGLSLQLLATLLVLQAHGAAIAEKELIPAAAFYVRLLRQLESVEHPEDGDDPDDPAFPLRGRNVRGVFDGDHFRSFDRLTQGGMSPVVNATVNKDGSLGRKDTTDFVESHEFGALLEYAKRKLAGLADELLEGRIEISPWRIGTDSPCPSCAYRGVCRFDSALNGYRFISLPKKEEVIRIALEGGK